MAKKLFDIIENAEEKNMENYKELLERYSTFDVDSIVSVLELFISGEENDFYSCSEINLENRNVLLISKSNLKISKFSFETIEKLKENESEKILILNAENLSDKNVVFFTLTDGKIKSCIDFSDFPYVEGLMISLVEYKFEKKIEKLSYPVLWWLTNKYFLDYEENIESQNKLKLNKNA